MINSLEEGFKDAGIRAIADRMKTRLHELDKTVDSNKGRWAWELLQNAKDSVADTDDLVSVQIELNRDKVEFRHNGKHFDEQDIIGIINQISSKEAGKEKKTKLIGRFGTGFLTTHLLSRVIDIKGIFESNEKNFYSFQFSLDRSGVTTEELIPKIEKARKDFLQSIKGQQIFKFDLNTFHTSFTYNLHTTEKKDIARVGTNEFIKLIPFVLASTVKISTVEIIDNTNKTEIKFENNHKVKDGFIIEILKTENNRIEPIKLILAQVDDVSILAFLKETESGYVIQNLKDIPKLFCDFPLIGTESFNFPVIVNSLNFTPRTERNGIWLKKDNDLEVMRNREILLKSVQLFRTILPQISRGKFFSLYNIVDTRTPLVDKEYFDEKWFAENIQVPLRQFIETIPIVDTVRYGRVAINDKENGSVDFPVGENKQETEIIWGIASIINDYFCLPNKNDVHFWNEISWNADYDFNEEGILHFIESKTNITKLKSSLDNKDVHDWLNALFKFAIEDKENIKAFEKYSCLPNQKGEFKKRTEISHDEIIDNTLKEVALLLNHDYYNILQDSEIIFEECSSTKYVQDIATTITNEITHYRKSNELIGNTKSAIRILTKWFDENEKKGEEYFVSLFRIKERLLVETIEDKISLYRVLSNEKQLAELAQIAEAMKNDPELFKQIA